MKSALRSVQYEALKIACDVQDWVRSRDKVNVRLNLSAVDRLRLLRLRTWERVYKVPLEEILDIIVPPLRVHSNLRARRYGLGTSVSSLTGYHAEQILSTIVLRKYPTNEHVGFWREVERDKQLYAEKLESLDGAQPREDMAYGSLLDVAASDTFLQNYTKNVMLKRKQARAEGDARWRTRKAYRGNPWIQ